MKLNIKERFILPSLYPEKGSLEEQGMMTALSDKVKFSKEEEKQYGIRLEDNDLTGEKEFKWDDTKVSFDIEFSDVEMAFLKERVEILNKEGLITKVMVSLCITIRGV